MLRVLGRWVFLLWVVGLFARQDVFIENIFEVRIPGVKGAYNPSMVEYGDGYLMAFRYDTYKEPIGYSNINDYCQFIGLVRLDKDFSPVGAWQPCLGKRSYDPRLFKWNDRVYMTFAAAGPKDPSSMLSSSLNLCALHEAEGKFFVTDKVSLKVPFQMTWEKNWVPFIFNGELFFEYMISPHRIVHPSGQDGRCEEVIFGQDSHRKLKWPYGPIRGGTPAIDIGD